MREAVLVGAGVLTFVACGSAGSGPPVHKVHVRAPVPKTTTPVEDPTKHDTTVIEKTIHDLNTTTTITLPRTS